MLAIKSWVNDGKRKSQDSQRRTRRLEKGGMSDAALPPISTLKDLRFLEDKA